jgi:hypothetical protein
MTEPAPETPAQIAAEDSGYEPPTAIVAGSIRSLTQDELPSDFGAP